jgi:hypothetical protein
MTCDARSAIQLQYNWRLQQHGLADSMRATNHELTTPKTEMLIGHWYLDEFGNRTREIKARDDDTAQMARFRAPLEPRRRATHIRAGGTHGPAAFGRTRR